MCTIKFYKKKRSSLCILRPTTQAVSWGLDQELGEEVLRLAADRLREPHVLHQDQLEQDVVVSVKQKLSKDKTITMMKIKVFELACCKRVTRNYFYYSFYYYLPVVEGKSAHHHLVHDNAHSPPDEERI